MTRSKRPRRQSERTGGAWPPERRLRVVALLGIVAAAVVLVVSMGRSGPPRPAPDPPGANVTAQPPATVPAITSSDTPPHFRPLVGEWLRPDGGYVLSVTGVALDGRVAVAYLNPRPIRVARAEARREGDLVGLFVQFDDVGYPGSTYTLGYDAASGQLKGLYYQAVQGQQYDVVFIRQR